MFVLWNAVYARVQLFQIFFCDVFFLATRVYFFLCALTFCEHACELHSYATRQFKAHVYERCQGDAENVTECPTLTKLVATLHSIDSFIYWLRSPPGKTSANKWVRTTRLCFIFFFFHNIIDGGECMYTVLFKAFSFTKKKERYLYRIKQNIIV